MVHPRSFGPRGSNRRFSADQTRIRGGSSGGGCPRPSGQESFCNGAILPEAAEGGRNRAAETPAKHWLMQAVINMHLSQPTGAGALLGQQGMPPAISSAIADMAISSAIAGIKASEVVPAMTSRESGASINPAIMKIASSRRMVI